jgi:16S rRNA (cytosine1402-N4)-methyltransferase
VNVVNIVPMEPLPPSQRSTSGSHVPVLLGEALTLLAPREGGLYVDCTLGAGGHAEAILRVPGTRLVGFDRDPSALALASARLARFGARFTAVHAPFSDLEAELEALSIRGVDGVLADVGVSSMQLDDPSRGMSFRGEGPIDMRMDPTRGQSALELIEELDDDELANVLYRLGEERRSRRVARCIKQALAAGELATTLDLRRAVVRALGPARVGGVDPATRTFQALRIAVNAELDELTTLIDAAGRALAPGGALAVISFHSLEDRIVKRAFQDKERWDALTKKPIVASDEEAAQNPRSRSAKLRAARRRPDARELYS